MTKFSTICSALGTACCGTVVVATFYPETFGLSSSTPTVTAKDSTVDTGISNTNTSNEDRCNECKDANKCKGKLSWLEDSIL